MQTRIKSWNTTSTQSRPSVYITKQKQRIKQHDGIVYLKDNDEFELEIFNPTTLNQLAKIKINGNYIKGSGIIIKPGQRIFLERYLDSNDKFIFNTYDVGTSKEVDSAIKFNGDVEIEFYKEKIQQQLLLDNTNWTQIPPFYPANTYPSTGNRIFGTTTNGITYYNNTTDNSQTIGNSNEVCTDSLSFQPTSMKQETGTVGKGSKSEQKFTTADMDFHIFSTTNIHWKILPESKQVYTSDTMKKVYCTECGTRIKKSSYKFCPNCGNKL